MKIKLLIGIPGYAPGAILEATPAPYYAVNNPKWFVGENTTGVYAYEAEEVTEEPDYEDEEAQITEVPLLQGGDWMCNCYRRNPPGPPLKAKP